MAKVILAGGSGFIGHYLKKKFTSEGHQVLIISRNTSEGHTAWSDHKALLEALEQSWLLINLAGKSVNCRHTEANKKAILESRTRTTATLNELVRQCKQPPQFWFNASGAAYYKASEDKIMTETDYEPGTSFMAEVSEQWEQALFAHEMYHTKRIAMRTAVVMGKGGGPLKPLSTLARLGLGGTQGSGRQMVSWIHIEDYYQIIRFLANKGDIEGPINFAAPEPVNNRVFMQTMRQVVHMPVGLPAPGFAINIGARIIGTEPELLLASSNVISERLQHAGFRFNYPSLSSALNNLL
ncbi:TIGR01777 family oxidoreductase [Edaphocola aurantiacus]|uniref:TIGR01777 family oxidoreductase n=1 Tax=Edaphocola aurantiacus TaxID=2601682 RepID=UPI001C985B96|nr:TIGR01777 family oxidoreductase [Edaphocola aurantiacus]